MSYFIKRIKRNDIETNLYILGLIISVVFIVASMTVYYLDLHLPPCILRTSIGLYCPGCGATRSFNFLLQGNILKVFYIILLLFIVLSFIVFL